jgi:hypothetical protein
MRRYLDEPYLRIVRDFSTLYALGYALIGFIRIILSLVSHGHQ